MIRNTTLFLLLFITHQGIAQHLEKSLALSASFTLRNTAFIIYSDSTVGPDFTTQSESRYDTPENVLRSELSANSMAWMDEVYLPGQNDATASDITEKISNLKFLSCKLQHKFTFLSPEGDPCCFLRGTILYNNNPFFGVCILYKKVNGRWYRSSMNDFRDLGTVIWVTKSEPLKALLHARNTGLTEIDKVISQTQTPYGFDPARFLALLETWKTQNDTQLNIFLDR